MGSGEEHGKKIERQLKNLIFPDPDEESPYLLRLECLKCHDAVYLPTSKFITCSCGFLDDMIITKMNTAGP
jgi:hypothetical protein